MRKLLLCITCLGLSSLAYAAKKGEYTYSTEGYCLLKDSGAAMHVLKAYKAKLKADVDEKTCKAFMDFVNQVKPKDWDYHGGQALSRQCHTHASQTNSNA